MAGLLASLLTGCSPAQSASQTGSSAGAEITWLTDYDAALKLAQFTNKLVVVDFYATWWWILQADGQEHIHGCECSATAGRICAAKN